MSTKLSQSDLSAIVAEVMKAMQPVAPIQKQQEAAAPSWLANTTSAPKDVKPIVALHDGQHKVTLTVEFYAAPETGTSKRGTPQTYLNSGFAGSNSIIRSLAIDGEAVTGPALKEFRAKSSVVIDM